MSSNSDAEARDESVSFPWLPLAVIVAIQTLVAVAYAVFGVPALAIGVWLLAVRGATVARRSGTAWT